MHEREKIIYLCKILNSATVNNKLLVGQKEREREKQTANWIVKISSMLLYIFTLEAGW